MLTRLGLRRSMGQDISTAAAKRVARQPYLWGKFQAWLALPTAVALYLVAYDVRGWQRYFDWILCVVCLIVWRGLSHKRRYGLVLFYLIALEAYANFAWLMEHSLATHHMDLFWLLQSSFFWRGMIWTTILYLIPCTLYYPKRWNEFS